MKRLLRPKRKASRRVDDARTRAAVEYVPMRLSKKGKWLPVTPDPDGGERTPSWLVYRLAQVRREQARQK